MSATARKQMLTCSLKTADTRRGKEREEDGLIQDYDTILKESALLTTFAGILFGFLLDISINAPEDEFA